MLFPSLSFSRPAPPPESSSALALEAQADAAMEAGDTRAAIEFYRAALEISPLHRPLRDKLGDALLMHGENRLSRGSSAGTSRMLAPLPSEMDEVDEEEEAPRFAPRPRKPVASTTSRESNAARTPFQQTLSKRLFPPPSVPKSASAEPAPRPAPKPLPKKASRSAFNPFTAESVSAPEPNPAPLQRPQPRQERRGPIVKPRSDDQSRRRLHSVGFAVLYAGVLLIVAGVAHGVLVRVLTPVELPSIPAAPTLPPELAARLEQATTFLSAREPEKAIALLETAESVYPDHRATILPALSRAIRVQGNVHLGRREYANAEKAFERAAELDAGNTDNWIDLAKARREHGRSLQVAQQERGNQLLRAAVDAYRKAVDIQPNLTAAHVGLGQTYTFLNDRAKAVDHFRRVVSIAPGTPEARLAEEQLAQLVGRS